MAQTLTEDLGTLPKELLAFIERKADRAIEMLREIVSEPEHVPTPAFAGGLGQAVLNAGLANQFGIQQAQAWGGATAGTTWLSSAGMNIANPMSGGFVVGG